MQIPTGLNPQAGEITEKSSYPIGIALIAALAGFIFGFDTVVI